MFEIEKNVPIPENKNGRKPMYPWRKMKEGDSFFVDNIDNNKSSSIMGMAYPKLAPGLRPCRRPEGNGYRFWAVAK